MRIRDLGPLLAAAILLAGCTVSVSGSGGDSGSTSVGIDHSVLRDGTLTLDLRSHPTRASFGMNATTSFAGYGSSAKPVRVVVELPRASLVFDRTDITAATDSAGGANDHDPTHPPLFFVLQVVYPDLDAARADARAKASALGLTGTQVEEALANPSGEHDVYGTPDGWRSARLSFTHDSDDPVYDGYYFFDLDVYHNPAVDRIKSGSVVDLDLRTRPSRAALGFVPGYPSASVVPDPGQALTLRLRTPTGTGSLPLSEPGGLDSEAGSDGTPTSSSALLCASTAQVRDRLLAVAGPLGLDRTQIAGLPVDVHAGAARVQRRLAGRTSAFATEVRYDNGNQVGLDVCATIDWTYPR